MRRQYYVMGKLWLLALLILTIGCVEESTAYNKTTNLSEHAETQVENYEGEFEGEKETEIEEDVS